MIEQILQLTLLLIGFVYWPLLYIRLSGKEAKKNALYSVIFAVAASLALFFVGHIYYNYTLLSFILAVVPVILLILAGRFTERRKMVKIIVLAAYFHIAWQMLPKIEPVLVATDIVGIGIVLGAVKFLARYKNRRPQKQKAAAVQNVSISDLWK